MKKILIISSTTNTNLDLSREIKNFIDSLEVKTEILSLEEFNLPLFTPTLENEFKDKQNFPVNIEKIKNILLNSTALIWCSPEYNGGISPIVTNTIAWISRATNDWKEAFNNKKVLICSSSGGNGKNFVQGFKIQLSYLGSIVNEEYIIRTKRNDIDKKFFTEVLSKFCSQI